nr:DNA-processing protein DprA [endosymbiont 'TC1' of Trimyema compressum]
MISVVGSRQSPSAYLKKAFNLGRGLAKAGWVVVSGLAKGIMGQFIRVLYSIMVVL